MNRRIFIAVDISAQARRLVSEYIDTLRGDFPDLRVGWDKAEKLHLTLKFLGDTTEEQLENLTEIVHKTAAEISNFRIKIAGTGVFPSPRNARVLWFGIIDEKENLPRISEILESECEKIGFPREKRNFTPHLTIARLREPRKSREIAKKHLQNEFELIEFEVSAIIIYESMLQPQGSIYSVVSKHRLEEIERG